MKNRKLWVALLICTAASAQKGGTGGGGAGGTGGGGGGTGVTPAGLVEVKAFSESITAGGTVQVKFSLTQPRPITSGGPTMPKSTGTVKGVSIASINGDAAGVALDQSDSLAISVISPDSDFGAALDYPFITVTMGLPSTMTAGSSIPLTFADTVVQSPTGPLTLSVTKPGTLTVAGTLSVDNVIPGGGAWPAGTLIRLRGAGFQPLTKVTTKMKTSRPVFINANEIQFVLAAPVSMEMQPITVANPDGSVVTYYSYLRGVPVSTPARLLLQKTDPIFQKQVHSLARFVVPAYGAGKFTALAFQNPNPSSVAIVITNNRSGIKSFNIVPSLGRLVDDLQSLLSGKSVLAGDSFTVAVTAPIQILGIVGDETAGTVKAFLPAF